MLSPKENLPSARALPDPIEIAQTMHKTNKPSILRITTGLLSAPFWHFTTQRNVSVTPFYNNKTFIYKNLMAPKIDWYYHRPG
jgi:hypothetical protein